MTYVLIIIGVLVLAGCIVLWRWWRRSQQHIGISHPEIEPGSVKYKQVIAPGADPDRIAQPSLQVEDVLAVRPGAPEPGKTFSPEDTKQAPPEPPDPPGPTQS